MRRLAATIALGLLALSLLAACDEGGDVDEWSTSDDDATAAAEASPALGPSPTAPAAASPEDPRDVLNELIQDPKDPDFERVYQHLPERFQVIDFDERWVRSIAQRLPNRDAVASVDEWELEEYDGYSLVRHPELFLARWVFVVEDGAWRWDPGDQQLLVAANRARGNEGFTVGFGSEDSYEVTQESEPDVNLLPSPVNISPMLIAVHDESIDVLLSLELRPGQPRPNGEPVDSHLISDTAIPLESISWEAEGESGGAEVTWANVGLVDDELLLHGWPEDEATDAADGGSVRYPIRRSQVSVRLTGVPDDVEEIDLVISEVTIGPFGDDNPLDEGDTLTYGFQHTIPAETTDPILIGEAPEVSGDDELDDTPEPQVEEDLPPAPSPGDELEIIDVEYESSGDSVEAVVSIDPNDARYEFPGPALVTWDDGTTTDVAPMITDGMIQLRAERFEPPHDAEVTGVEFEQLVYSLGTDTNATFYQDRFETEWGEFPVMDIVDSQRVEYQPAGNRYLGGVALDHDGSTVSVSGVSTGFDQDFQLTRTRLEFGTDLEPALEDLPLPAELEVWAAETDVTLELP